MLSNRTTGSATPPCLTCKCPTPFPHLNALSHHPQGCCYNPVVRLWCGDIVFWVPIRFWSGWNCRAFAQSDRRIRLLLTLQRNLIRPSGHPKRPVSFYSESPERLMISLAPTASASLKNRWSCWRGIDRGQSLQAYTWNTAAPLLQTASYPCALQLLWRLQSAQRTSAGDALFVL